MRVRAVTRATRAQAPNFHELYDNSKDPYQLANGWPVLAFEYPPEH